MTEPTKRDHDRAAEVLPCGCSPIQHYQHGHVGGACFHRPAVARAIAQEREAGRIEERAAILDFVTTHMRDGIVLGHQCAEVTEPADGIPLELLEFLKGSMVSVCDDIAAFIRNQETT